VKLIVPLLFSAAALLACSSANAQYRYGYSSPVRAYSQPRVYVPTPAPSPGYRWNPSTPPAYYQQQNRVAIQQFGQVYRQYQQNPYVNAARLSWSGVQCAGGALVAVGTDGAGAVIFARTGYACTQAGLAAWRYGQALGS
jgi:hypothetical protein